MQNEIKVDDEFILHKGDAKFKIVIYNVNYYRPPDMTFAILLYDEDGNEIENPYDDFFFIGEDFFIKHKEEIERIYMKKKVKFDIPLEYVIGHLRYGHKEGVLELTEEEFKKLQEDPLAFIYTQDILCDLDLIIDDYEVDDYGGILKVNYEVVDDAE